MISIDYYVHGITEDNELGKATGWNDIGLSQNGIEQVKNAAINIDFSKYDAIFSSDLLRAKQSAIVYFEGRINEIIYDKRLRECNYGLLSGANKKYVNYAEHIIKPFPEGESLMDVQNRIEAFINTLSLLDVNSVAIISHKAPQLALEVILNKMSWENVIENDWRHTGDWRLYWTYKVF